MPPPNISICVEHDQPSVQLHAVVLLQDYLKKLFGVEAKICHAISDAADYQLIVGQATHQQVCQAAGAMPALSDQGFLLRRISPGTILLAGGSRAATAWAVYELLERYGVRYLLHGDVLPSQQKDFYLPDVDAVCEPVHRLRSWRLCNELPTGTEVWSLAQARQFIQQLFKLKFNSIYLSLWPQQPVIHYQVQGISRRSCSLLFGQKIPIDDDTIGKEHLPEAPYLINPEFLGADTFEQRMAVGQRRINSLLECAHHLDMHTAIFFQPLEFPQEFRPLLEKSTAEDEAIQLGGVTCAEKGDLTNRGHVALVEAKFRAYLEQYSHVDALYLSFPEHPQADARFSQCWDELNQQFKLEPQFELDDLLQQARHDHLVAGGAIRAQRESKSAITMLHFLNRFFAGNDLLQQAANQKIKVGFSAGMGYTQVFGLLDRVLWQDATLVVNLSYTASCAVRRLEQMEAIHAENLPTALTITLQDDNIGSLPQVATESNHVLLQQAQRLGWQGYFTRFWPIGDLDPVTAYLAQASWDKKVTPRSAYTDHFSHLYGDASVETWCQVMRMLEDATVILDIDFLSLFFPVQGIMKRFVHADKPLAEGLHHIRALYEQCRYILRRLHNTPVTSSGAPNLAYWINRLTFAIEALQECNLLCDGGLAVAAAKQAKAADQPQMMAQHLARAEELYRKAVTAGENAMRATALVVRDDSDRGTLAAYYHFLVRQVSEECQEAISAVADQSLAPSG